MACGPAPEQTYFFDLLDGAGPHPQAVRPPKIEADYEWRVGDPIPPGVVPPPEGEPGGTPTYWPRGFGYDPEIASEVWQAVLDSIPATVPEIPMPFTCIVETRRCDDGAAWACLVAHHDGGLSYVVLRDGVLEWEDASGAGLLIWRQAIHSWARLPAKKTYDADRHAWVWKDASAHPVVEAPEPSDVAPEPEPSATPDVAPEPAVPVVVFLPSGGPAAFLHAHHLATDVGWKALAVSLDRTTSGDVRNAVARHVAAGSLSAVNAEALLACIEDPEAPEPGAEEPNVAPDNETAHGLPDPADFLANIWRLQEMNRAVKGVKWCPLRALIEAGLAKQVGQRVFLLPPASDALEMRHCARPGQFAKVNFTLREGADLNSDIVRRVEKLVGIGVHPDAPLILSGSAVTGGSGS